MEAHDFVSKQQVCSHWLTQTTTTAMYSTTHMPKYSSIVECKLEKAPPRSSTKALK